MKKLLTALLVSSAFAAPAFAQDDTKGVSLGITGYFKGYVVASDQDEATGQEARGVDIIRDTEMHFVGSTTLDNGLTVGADIGSTVDQGDSFDVQDSYVYFSGDWGRVNFGATDGAAYLLQVSAPSTDANYDGMDQYYTPFNYAVTGVTELSSIEFDYDQDITTPSDKLTYISPIWSGFQVGVSYTPEVRTASRSLNGVATDEDEDDLADVWDAAARYGGEMEWGSYSVGLGYTHGDNEDGVGAGSTSPSEDRTAWNVGADFNIGAWGLGAVYTKDDLGELGGEDSDQTQWVLGVDYSFDNIVLGASYLNQDNEFGDDEIDTDRFTGGVTWKYGPGIDFRGVVTHVDHDVDAALGDDVSGTALMLGTSISF